jgi:hypothetical protein
MVAGQIASTALAARRSVDIGQRAVASRADLPQSTIVALERGEAGRLPLDTSLRVLDALGIEARLVLDGPIVRNPGRRRDPVHAWMAGRLGIRLRRLGWEVIVEAEVGSGRYRGFIDLLGYRATDRSVLVVEVKTEIRDAGAVIRTLRWYEREAPAAARRRGWRPLRTCTLLAVLDSRAATSELMASASLARSVFPADPTSISAWLADPSLPAPAGYGVGFVDPASRARAWLRRGRVQGRRSESPYEDYADAVRRLPGRPR